MNMLLLALIHIWSLLPLMFLFGHLNPPLRNRNCSWPSKPPLPSQKAVLPFSRENFHSSLSFLFLFPFFAFSIDNCCYIDGKHMFQWIPSGQTSTLRKSPVGFCSLCEARQMQREAVLAELPPRGSQGRMLPRVFLVLVVSAHVAITGHSGQCRD